MLDTDLPIGEIDNTDFPFASLDIICILRIFINLLFNYFLKAAALSVMPVDKLKQKAQEKFDRAKSSDPDINPSLFRDLLLLEFKEWFKTDFFHWVDTPPCPRCGKPSQVMKDAK